MKNISVASVKITNAFEEEKEDLLSVEEPLEIRLGYTNRQNNEREQQNIAVTMRTPGHDLELAAGFLYTEGIIKKNSQIESLKHCCEDEAAGVNNIVRVELKADAIPQLNQMERNFYTTSSCGICGKSSIDAVNINIPDFKQENDFKINKNCIVSLPEKLRSEQTIFKYTGSIHAAAFFTPEGKLISLREDIGRHNALDKLIGTAFIKNELPLNNLILLLSGRICFELVQKAAMAGIKIIVAVGGASNLSVDMAKANNITLIGFLRGEKFTCYSNPERIVFN